jgi:tyrosyl-tRNA synthetase
VQQMIQRDMFQKRLSENLPISLQEFMYPLMQGYDSVVLDVDLEIGGNDQMFNMLVGRTLQKIYNNKDKDVLTCKLLLGTDGRKMSKTFGNFIAIGDSSNDMFGKVMSVKDELLDHYFELATRLSNEKIAEIKKSGNPRDIKAKLAKEIVKMYHGEKESQKAEDEFNKVHRDKELPSDMPVFEADKSNYFISDLLVESKMAPSKNEAKRLVEGGGVEIINGDRKERVADWKKEINLENGMIIKVGSRKFVKINLR